jgi:serine/threonine protein phosphatase PrpC
MNPRGACTWIHVGDSRIYQFREGRLIKRTRDHSYVQALLDRGEITEDEIEDHPQSNILLGCLGMATAAPPIETHFIPQLEPGDALLACSDGLWHYFSPGEMGALIAERTPREAVELLIEEARLRARGGGDNISLAILKLEPLPK